MCLADTHVAHHLDPHSCNHDTSVNNSPLSAPSRQETVTISPHKSVAKNGVRYYKSCLAKKIMANLTPYFTGRKFWIRKCRFRSSFDGLRV